MYKRIFHWQILILLVLGAVFCGSPGELAFFFLRAAGTCAVFYVFFLCRMMGAGDIKLMAALVGSLGCREGCEVLFFGLLAAAVRGGWLLFARGVLWERLCRILAFVVQTGREGKLAEYPEDGEKDRGLRLGPYLFLGYCIYLCLNNSVK